MCNQSAGFNRCITKIQDSVQENLKALQTELCKGKSSVKPQTALDELHYLASFNQNVSFAMGKSLQHLSDFIFVQMANLTLAHRDAYLENFKPGVKHDTFSALRNCPLNGYALFPDALERQKMRSLNTKTPSVLSSPVRAMGGSLVVLRSNNNSPTLLTGNNLRTLHDLVGKLARICPHGCLLAIGVDLEVEAGEVNQDAAPARLRINHSINDNYCLASPVPVDGVPGVQRQNFSVSVQQPVLCPVVTPVPFCLKCERAVTKERRKSLIKHENRNKFCEKYFFCRSLRFCPKCSQCPQCCK